MSPRSSYGSSYAQDKGAYTSRSSSPRSTSSSTPSSSLYAHSAQSSRNHRYGSKPQPTTVHNGGGPVNDPNTSTSAANSGYYK